MVLHFCLREPVPDDGGLDGREPMHVLHAFDPDDPVLIFEDDLIECTGKVANFFNSLVENGRIVGPITSDRLSNLNRRRTWHALPLPMPNEVDDFE